LSFQWFTIKPIFMAQLPPQKRRKRRVQLREAQRRRRARLKEESKSFLQIILDQETLRSLRAYSDSTGKPLHICAADLIRNGLSLAAASVPKLSLVPQAVRKENRVEMASPALKSSTIVPSDVREAQKDLSSSLPKPPAADQMDFFPVKQG
jgi:hypothetical protein